MKILRIEELFLAVEDDMVNVRLVMPSAYRSVTVLQFLMTNSSSLEIGKHRY